MKNLSYYEHSIKLVKENPLLLIAGTVIFSSVFISILLVTYPVVVALIIFAIALPGIYKFRKIFIMVYGIWLPLESLLLKYVPPPVDMVLRYGGEAVIFLLFVMVIGNKLVRNKLTRTTLDIPLIIFGGAILVSMLANRVPLIIAVMGIKNFIRYIFLFFIVTQSKWSQKDIRRFMAVLYLSGSLQVLVGLVQIVGRDAIQEFFRPKDVMVNGKLLLEQVPTLIQGARINGTLVRYGIYAGFINMFISMLLAKRYVIKKRNIIDAVLLCLSFSVVLASFSRKNWFALFLLYIVFNVLTGQKAKSVSIILSTFCLIFILALFKGIPNSYIERSPTDIVERLLVLFSREYWSHSLERTRFYVMTRAVYKLAQDYFWFGVGPGMIGSVATGTAAGSFGLFNVQSSLILDDPRLVLITDVGFVNIFAQFGIVGFASFVGTLYRLLSVARSYLKRKSLQVRVFSFTVIGFMIVMFMGQAFGSAFEYRALSYYFWLFSGLMLSMDRGAHDRFKPSGTNARPSDTGLKSRKISVSTPIYRGDQAFHHS